MGPPCRRHDMTCREAVLLVAAYLDGALLGDARPSSSNRTSTSARTARSTSSRSRRRSSSPEKCAPEHLDPLAREDLMDLYRRWRSEQDLS